MWWFNGNGVVEGRAIDWNFQWILWGFPLKTCKNISEHQIKDESTLGSESAILNIKGQVKYCRLKLIRKVILDYRRQSKIVRSMWRSSYRDKIEIDLIWVVHSKCILEFALSGVDYLPPHYLKWIRIYRKYCTQ